MNNQGYIEQLVRQQEKAIRSKDIETAMRQYAPDILSFDVVNSLQKTGLEECRKRLQDWLNQFPGDITFDVENLSVVTSETLAYCTSINHVNGMTSVGNTINMRWRATVCYQKREQEWLITHEHSSVPFDPENGQALMDLNL